MFDSPLPVPAEPLANESGYGYCLRLAAINSMSVAQLVALIDLKSLGQMASNESEALAFLGGASPKALGEKFPVLLGQKAGAGFCGHILPHRSMLRWWRHPQICPACVAANGWCSLDWDFSLSVVCLEHQCLLTDECPTCGKRLTWDRPSVEWGSCNHYLGMHPNAIHAASDELLLFGQQVRSLFECKVQKGGHAGMLLQLPLSLGGFFMWAYAFGLNKRLTGPTVPGAYSTVPRSKDAVALVQRALDRWKAFNTGSVPAMESLRLVVAELALQDLITRSSDPADLDVGMDLYRALYGEKALNSLVRRHGVGRQLTLFP